MKYKEHSIFEIFPPPPSPPIETSSYSQNKKIREQYDKTIKEWEEGFDDWKRRREEDIINDRFELLDL